MSDVAKVTYHGIEITYSEYDERWEYTLRNIDRSAKTLKAAKEAIDKKPPENKKPFEKITVYEADTFRTSVPKLITITSLADRGLVWATGADGKRGKTGTRNLKQANEANRAKVSEIENLSKQINALYEQMKTLHDSLEPFTLPKDVETGTE